MGLARKSWPEFPPHLDSDTGDLVTTGFSLFPLNSQRFIAMSAKAESRAIFIMSAIGFLREHMFDMFLSVLLAGTGSASWAAADRFPNLRTNILPQQSEHQPAALWTSDSTPTQPASGPTMRWSKWAFYPIESIQYLKGLREKCSFSNMCDVLLPQLQICHFIQSATVKVPFATFASAWVG